MFLDFLFEVRLCKRSSLLKVNLVFSDYTAKHQHVSEYNGCWQLYLIFIEHHSSSLAALRITQLFNSDLKINHIMLQRENALWV